MKYYIAACNYIVFRIFWERGFREKENPRRVEKRVDMKILTFTLGILFLLGSIQQAKAQTCYKGKLVDKTGSPAVLEISPVYGPPSTYGSTPQGSQHFRTTSLDSSNTVLWESFDDLKVCDSTVPDLYRITNLSDQKRGDDTFNSVAAKKVE